MSNLKDTLKAHGESLKQLADISVTVTEQLAELTDLLKRADRIEFNGGHRWLYWDDAVGVWTVREHGPYAKRGHDLCSGPSLIEALKKLLEKEA